MYNNSLLHSNATQDAATAEARPRVGPAGADDLQEGADPRSGGHAGCSLARVPLRCNSLCRLGASAAGRADPQRNWPR